MDLHGKGTRHITIGLVKPTCTSEALLTELADVLSRRGVVRKHRRNPEERAAYVQAIRDGAEMVSLVGSVHVCRDPDDNALIETAERGGAECVVSEDRDLHAPESTQYLAKAGVSVLTVREFLALLDAEVSDPAP